MGDMPDMTTLGILATQISYLREDIAELRVDVAKSKDNKVSHREWSQRNDHVNNRMNNLGREIGDLRTELRAKSAPWWSVGAVAVASLALLWNMFSA